MKHTTYTVLIRTAEGGGGGDRPLKYVIVADDDSPWAHRLRCYVTGRAVSDAASKARFAPDDAAYREANAQAVARAKQARGGLRTASGSPLWNMVIEAPTGQDGEGVKPPGKARYRLFQ